MRPSAEGAVSFSFGQNWAKYVSEHFSEERVRIAQRHLTAFLELPSLEGKSFIDVGCGSGLSSLAAFDAGAGRLVSFDCDPASVETTRRLRELRGNPENWTVAQGSVLDREFLRSLEPADIVYSWGVLHHTGSMWEAIENAATLLNDSGALFYIALYATTPKSDYWTEVKQRYNAAPAARKRAMEVRCAIRHFLLPELVRGRNPLAFLRKYQERRGMEAMTDIRDWLGGYPYEHARIPEVMAFCRKKLDLMLINLNPDPGFAEYLFTRVAPRANRCT
ncbi:MAG: class I SAM-dependent methyltransferase [Bryobacteraceae bacterium]